MNKYFFKVRNGVKTFGQSSLVLATLMIVAVIVFVSQISVEERRTLNRLEIPDYSSGQIALGNEVCAENPRKSSIHVSFKSDWTSKTLEKNHSTLLHLGNSESRGLRLDLGRGVDSQKKSYFLIIGSQLEPSGYRVEEFPLRPSDYGRVWVSLFASRGLYELELRTRSEKVLISRGIMPEFDCSSVYIGGGPVGLLPKFSDTSLYPSETENTKIIIEQGRIVKSSKFGFPDAYLSAAHLLLRLVLMSLIVQLFLRAVANQYLSFVWQSSPRSSLITLGLALWVIVVPAWWIQAGYLEKPVTEMLSFLVNDLNCEPRTQGIGMHCFGDFWGIQEVFQIGGKTDYAENLSIYPPLGMLPSGFVTWVSGVLDLSSHSTLVVYLGLSTLALSAPAIYSMRTARAFPTMLPFLLIGPSSLPALMVLDRGNNLAFVVPLLLLFVVLIQKDQYFGATICLSLVASFKPQFALALVIFVGLRRWKALIAGLLAVIGFLGIGFLLWPGNPIENGTHWFENVLAYRDYQSPSDEYPPNLSVLRAVYQVSKILGFSHSPSEIYAVILGLLVLLTFLLRGEFFSKLALVSISLICPMVLVPVSYHYYLVVLLPLGAMIFASSDSFQSRRFQLTDKVIAVAIALSLVPIPLAIGNSKSSIVPHFSGLIWLAACIFIIGIAWLPKKIVSPKLLEFK